MNVRNGIESLTQIFSSQPAASPTSAKGGSGTQSESVSGDKANLSALATQASQVAGASDVRLDKVAAIQNALQAGTYHVPAAEVAQKVIASLLAPER